MSDLEDKAMNSGLTQDEKTLIKAIIRTMEETRGPDQPKFKGDIYSGHAISDYSRILFESNNKLKIKEMEKKRAPYMPKFKGDIKSETAIADYESVLDNPVTRVAAKFKLWTSSYIDWKGK